MYKGNHQRAMARLQAASEKRVAEGKALGLNLVPHQYKDWEVEVEKNRMLDELQDVLGDVRRILEGEGKAPAKVKAALERLGEVEQ